MASPTYDRGCLRDFRERIKNEMTCDGRFGRRVGSGLRPPAIGLIGPFPIQPDDAELDTVAQAEHATVLGDRVIHRAPQAVGDEHGRTAEPARYGAGRPRLPSDLMDLL